MAVEVMPSIEQRMSALAIANQSRAANAGLKRELTAGEISFAEALGDERVGPATVVELLLALPGWGRVRAQRSVKGTCILLTEQARRLGEGQKELLLQRVVEHSPRRGPRTGPGVSRGYDGQAQFALQRANQERLAAAAVKAELAAGDISFEAALADPRAGSATVLGMLTAQHRWGRARALAALEGTFIPDGKRIRDLTDRQRDTLVLAVDPPPLDLPPVSEEALDALRDLVEFADDDGWATSWYLTTCNGRDVRLVGSRLGVMASAGFVEHRLNGRLAREWRATDAGRDLMLRYPR